MVVLISFKFICWSIYGFDEKWKE